MQKIACDYKGPFKHKSREGYNGFYLFSDYKSDYLFAYPVKSKAKLPYAVKVFYEN